MLPILDEESTDPLVSNGKQVAGVLRVDLPVRAKRSWCIRRADVQLLEDPLLQCATLVDRVEEAVLTISVDHTVGINHWGVDTPLEAVRMCAIINTGD